MIKKKFPYRREQNDIDIEKYTVEEAYNINTCLVFRQYRTRRSRFLFFCFFTYTYDTRARNRLQRRRHNNNNSCTISDIFLLEMRIRNDIFFIIENRTTPADPYCY